MQFALQCKVCKEFVGESEMFEHLKKHPPICYYDLLPIVEWPKQNTGTIVK